MKTEFSIAIIAMVEDPHKLQSVNVSSNGNQTSESIRFNISTPVGLHENNRTFLETAGNTSKQPREHHANIFLTSESSIKTPLISQEKFHWDQVR